ncbi:MAG: ABC transporter ATP-binding protein, partial [Salinibacter sp.]
RVSIMVEGTIDALGEPAVLKADYDADTMDDVFVKVATGEEATT